MKAVYIKEFGTVKNLEIREVENPPSPIGNQVLVRVKAAGINRADILQRKGFYPAPEGFPARILGLEFAGEVAEIGADVRNLKINDRVFGIVSGGGQAEFVLTGADQLAAIPANLSFTEAAAVPEAFITAHDALFTRANLQAGETILIHAVASGVGLAALQLAKAKNARVFGTSRTIGKLEKCKQFGLDEAILIGENINFADTIKEKSGGVNIIVDLVGAKYFAENLNGLALKGRLILIGLVSGKQAEFDLGIALAKRLQITGTVLRARSPEEKADATRRFSAEVLPLLESGAVVPNIDRIFPLEEIQKAHEYVEANESFGKVVLDFQQ